jgi:hypothetical protein
MHDIRLSHEKTAVLPNRPRAWNPRRVIGRKMKMKTDDEKSIQELRSG